MHTVTRLSLQTLEERVPVAGVDARQPELGRDLGEADRVHALGGDALDLGRGEGGIPHRDDAERDVHAARGLAPLLDHPVVVRADAGQAEVEVLALHERLPAEARERRERQRAVHPVRGEVLDARVAVVAARAHLVVRHGGHLELRPVESAFDAVRRRVQRDGDEALVDVDEPVLVDPAVAGQAVGVDGVLVPRAGLVHEWCPAFAFDAGALGTVFLRQPGLPDMRRLDHVVVHADDLGQVHTLTLASENGRDHRGPPTGCGRLSA